MNFAAPTTASAEVLPRGSSTPRTRLPGILGLGVAVVNAIVYWPAAFGGWNFYDDEGAMLIAFRSFAERGGLYSKTYSNYGPFPFALWWTILRPFGFAYDNLFVGRLLALILLVFASWLTYDALRVRTSIAWSVIGAFAVSATLILNFSEPFHPGALIGALLAVGFWAQTRIQNPKARLAVEGGVCAALSFTKVNVGVFFAVAWLTTGLLRDPKWATGYRRVMVVLVASTFPFFIIVSSAHDVPTVLLATSVASAVALACLAAHSCSGAERTTRFLHTLPMFALGGAIVAGFSLGVTMARGSTIRDILDGVLFRAVRQRGVFSAAPRFDSPRLALFLTVLPTVGFCVSRLRGSGRAQAGDRTDRFLLSGAQALGGLGLVAAPSFRIALLPVLALLFIDLPGARHNSTPRSQEHQTPLLFGVLFAILQVLHAYPVAQSQLAWATMLLAMCGVLLGAKGIDNLSALIRSDEGGSGNRSRKLHAGLTLAPLLLVVGRPIAYGPARWAAYRALAPLDSRHATFVRLEKDRAQVLRRISSALASNCSAVYSLPGMYTFNAMANLPIATGYNATIWTSLFTDADQKRAIQQLSEHERLCIVRNDFVLKFWTKQALPNGPLLDYVNTFDQELTSIGGYSISVRPTSGD